MAKEIMNVDEAKAYLGVSKAHLYRLTHEKKVKFSKPGGKKLYFLRNDLDNYMLGKLNNADFLSVAEAKEVTGLSEKMIRQLCEDDLIPNWKRQGEYYFQRVELIIWTEELKKRVKI